MRLHSVVVVVGCVFVGFVTSAGPGLMARAAEPQRWVQRALEARDSTQGANGEAESRIAQLEQQLELFEAEKRAAVPRAPTSVTGSGELAAALARNNELVARNRALAAENQALQSHLFEAPPSASACQAPAADADPKEQLRYWAERLRRSDGAFRDRLTTAQNTALNVLLRGERELDPHNPWREP